MNPEVNIIQKMSAAELLMLIQAAGHPDAAQILAKSAGNPLSEVETFEGSGSGMQHAAGSSSSIGSENDAPEGKKLPPSENSNSAGSSSSIASSKDAPEDEKLPPSENSNSAGSSSSIASSKDAPEDEKLPPSEDSRPADLSSSSASAKDAPEREKLPPSVDSRPADSSSSSASKNDAPEGKKLPPSVSSNSAGSSSSIASSKDAPEDNELLRQGSAGSSHNNLLPAADESNRCPTLEEAGKADFLAYLKSKKVEQYMATLWENEIRSESDLAELEETDIDSFCRILKHKSVFRRMLQELKQKFSQGGGFMEPNQKFSDLRAYLQTQTEGVALMAYYDKHQELENGQQNDLVKLILLEASRRNIKTYRNFNMFIANKIVELFPKERVETYYRDSFKTPEGKFVAATGKLVKRKTPVFKAMDIASPSQPKRQKLVNDESKAGDSVENENVQLDAKSWLVRGRTPDDMIIEQWNLCHDLRRKEIARATCLGDILDQYPILEQPIGGSLLTLDFERRYPEANKRFYLGFPTLHEKLPEILSKTRMDTLNMHRFKLYKSTKNGQIKDHLLIYFLPLLVQTNFKVQNKWRPSIVEVQELLFIEANSTCAVAKAVQTAIDQLEKNSGSKSLQPHIVVVGDLESAAYLVMFGGAEYKAENVLDAIRLCLNICFALDLKYPAESSPVWEFFQTHLFGIPANVTAKSCQNLVKRLQAV